VPFSIAMRAVFAVFCLVMVATQCNQEAVSLSGLDDFALSEDSSQVKGPFGDLQTQDADLKTMWADTALEKTEHENERGKVYSFGETPNPLGRVNEASFKTFMKAKYGARTTGTVIDGSTQNAAYDEFLGTVFAAATSMMLPEIKTDLGQHCFTYAAALAGEFYFANDSAPDRLKLKGAGAVADLDTSWTNIPKDNGRVAKANFIAFFAGKYSADTTEYKTAAFQTFADKVFTAATSMMLPTSKTDLGEHCFKYAAGLIGEFYF